MGYFSLADNPLYDDTSVKADISALQTGKVDKADGMSLIEDAEKERLSTVANYDDTEIKADIAKCATKDVATTTKNGLMSATDKKKLNGLATVATTGSYNDLKDKPNTSDYTVFMQETQPTQDGLWIKGSKKDFRFTQCDLRVPNNPILLSTPEVLSGTGYCSSISFDKYIYFFGKSLSSNTNEISGIAKFDTTTNTGEILSTKLPHSIIYPVTAISGGYIYIFGGREEYGDYSSGTNTIFRFDPVTESCIQLSVTCPISFSCGCAFTINGIIYICPGLRKLNTPCRVIWKFNPKANTCVALESPPSSFSYDGNACVVDGKGYVFWDDGKIIEFDPDTETSRTLNSTVRSSSTIAAINDVVYIFGGNPSSSNLEIYYFKPNEDVLKKLTNTMPTLPTGSYYSYLSSLTVGKDIYIFKGNVFVKMLPLVYEQFNGYYIKLSSSGKMTKISDNFIAQVEGVHSGVNCDDKIEAYSIIDGVATKIE